MMVAILALVAAGCGGSSTGSNGKAQGPLALNTGPAPWPDPDRVADRTAAAALSGKSVESLAVHYHAHLDIFVNGIHQPVAASIGRVRQSYFSPLHTHATSGMVHIEAPTDVRITLGMLFTEWGVRLTSTCAGGYCEPGTPVVGYVNGSRTHAPLTGIVLTRGEEIALVIGSPPATVPSSWDCNGQINPKLENPTQCKDFSGGA
jgi:hypothetical protein